MGKAVLLACHALAWPIVALAEGTATPEDIVRTEVAACTDRALANEFELEDVFSWPAACAEKVNDKCTKAVLNDADTANDLEFNTICNEFENTAWKDAGNRLRQHLIDRWQNCGFPADITSQMIARIDRLDTTLDEFSAAACDYDASQWVAVDQAEIAARRLPRCLAQMQTGRAGAYFQFVRKDVGCGTDAE
jgi:hypothetical protein